MPTTFDIEFENNPEKVAYAGSLLRGTVTITLTKKKNVRSIKFRIKGRAHADNTGCLDVECPSAHHHRARDSDKIYLEKMFYFIVNASGNWKDCLLN